MKKSVLNRNMMTHDTTELYLHFLMDQFSVMCDPLLGKNVTTNFTYES